MIPSRRLLLTPKSRPVPLQVGAPIIWFKASSVKLLDGLGVAIGMDQGGLGNHVIQATAGSQALLKLNALNGKPTLRFDGADDTLQKTAFTTMPMTFTVIAVVTYAVSVDATQGSIEISNGSLNSGMLLYHDGTAEFRIHDDVGNKTFAAGDYRDGVARIHAGHGDGTTGKYFVNNTQVGISQTYGVNSNVLNQLDVGRINAAGWFLNGDIAEIIIYATALSTGAMKVLHRYLGREYGIVVAA